MKLLCKFSWNHELVRYLCYILHCDFVTAVALIKKLLHVWKIDWYLKSMADMCKCIGSEFNEQILDLCLMLLQCQNFMLKEWFDSYNSIQIKGKHRCMTFFIFHLIYCLDIYVSTTIMLWLLFTIFQLFVSGLEKSSKHFVNTFLQWDQCFEFLFVFQEVLNCSPPLRLDKLSRETSPGFHMKYRILRKYTKVENNKSRL